MTVSSSVRASRLSGALENVLRRVLRNRKLARHGLKTDTVHDLRVALRRCRSLAEGFAEMDPRPVWQGLRKACEKQQSGLSELRDSQVLFEWVERLGLNRGPYGQALVDALKKEERKGRHRARASLKSFEHKDWKGWSRALPEAAGSLPVGKSRLARIAFDRATAVCLLERRWRRTYSGMAWHRLRVGVKRFRYAVESFLPAQHLAWAPQLKRLQDLLGEGHDLDVLRTRILQVAKAQELPQNALEQWLRKVASAREQRTKRYVRASVLTERERRIASKYRGGLSGNPPKEIYVYDSWRRELARLAKVNPSDAAKPTKLAAIPG